MNREQKQRQLQQLLRGPTVDGTPWSRRYTVHNRITEASSNQRERHWLPGCIASSWEKTRAQEPSWTHHKTSSASSSSFFFSFFLSVTPSRLVRTKATLSFSCLQRRIRDRWNGNVSGTSAGGGPLFTWNLSRWLWFVGPYDWFNPWIEKKNSIIACT